MLSELGAAETAQELATCWRISDEIGSSFYRPRLSVYEGWRELREGDREGARRWFVRGLEESGDVELDRVWNGWIEVLAWEEAEDADALEDVGTRLLADAGEDAPWFAMWGSYANVVAAALRGEWAEALSGAERLLESSAALGDRLLRWRAERLVARASTALGRRWDASATRAHAAEGVHAMAAGLPNEETRASFLSRPDMTEVLAEPSGVFGSLTADHLEELGRAAEIVDAADGEVLWRRGDPADRVVVVDDGDVALLAGGETIARLSPGEVFGEEAFVREERSLDAVAVGRARVLAWDPQRLLETMETRPAVAERLVAELGGRLREAGRLLQDQRHRDVPERLMRTIQWLVQVQGRGGGVLEVFPVFLRGGVLGWLRPAGGPPLRLSGGASQPNQAVVDALVEQGIRPRAVHSTSWRFEGDRVVLTYLAVVDGRTAQGWESNEVRRKDLARGTATGPPPEIGVEQVIEHGLRHLAWLIKDDPVIRDLLREGWPPLLAGYEPEPFRGLGQSFVAHPATAGP